MRDFQALGYKLKLQISAAMLVLFNPYSTATKNIGPEYKWQ